MKRLDIRISDEDKTVLELKYVQGKNVVRATPMNVDSIEAPDKKPKDISKLNDNKGFAIWIDKSRVTDVKREIYELLRSGRKYNQRNRLPATEFIEGVRDVWIEEYTPENSGRAMF